MLTYNLQPRVFKIESQGGKLIFPNDVIIEIKLGPSVAFGGVEGFSRSLVQNRKAELIYNANTGRLLAQSLPPLETIQVIIEGPDNKFALDGNILRWSGRCDSHEHLIGTMNAFYFIFPPLLNVTFHDPPFVEYIKGRVGNIDFTWEHQECLSPFTVINQEIREKAVAEAYERLPLFNGISNRRVAAALYYFHIASRLIVSGETPWEFMAEAILNFSKSLEVLFVSSQNSREDVRHGLNAIGFSDEEIEGDFLPLLILRSFADVAHPRVAIHDQQQMRILYRFLSTIEVRFRNLFIKLLKAIENRSYMVRQEKDLELKGKDRMGMERLIRTLESRIQQNSAPITQQKNPADAG